MRAVCRDEEALSLANSGGVQEVSAFGEGRRARASIQEQDADGQGGADQRSPRQPTLRLDDFALLGQGKLRLRDGAPPVRLSRSGTSLMVWDTETTGFGAAAVCQIAYLVIEHGSVRCEDHIVRLPNGFRISDQATQIHGITQHMSDMGEDPLGVLQSFVRDVESIVRKGGRCVGHNVGYDVRAVNTTLVALGQGAALHVADQFDTMQMSRRFSPLRTKNDRAKAFKLCELYEHLYHTCPGWARLHDAMEDVIVTTLCYQQAEEQGWW